MAMEATHIRFALDLQDKLSPIDLDAFIAGAVYPDSRYISHVDRLATHPEEYLHDPIFRSSDFRKGWLAHLLCDDVQYHLMTEKVPRVTEGTRGQGGETWIKRTAIKVLQDLNDVRQFDLARYLSSLSHVECPNGESENVLRSYHSLLQKDYAKTPDISMDDELDIWMHFGIGEELLNAIRNVTQTYAADAELMDEVRKLYETALEHARTSL